MSSCRHRVSVINGRRWSTTEDRFHSFFLDTYINYNYLEFMIKLHIIGSGMMNENRGRLAHILIILWVGVAYGLLVFLGHYTVELYYTVSFIGFLTIKFLFAPPQSSDRWWSLLRWPTVLGLLVFGYIILQQVLAVIQP